MLNAAASSSRISTPSKRLAGSAVVSAHFCKYVALSHKALYFIRFCILNNIVSSATTGCPRVTLNGDGPIILVNGVRQDLSLLCEIVDTGCIRTGGDSFSISWNIPPELQNKPTNNITNAENTRSELIIESLNEDDYGDYIFSCNVSHTVANGTVTVYDSDTYPLNVRGKCMRYIAEIGFLSADLKSLLLLHHIYSPALSQEAWQRPFLSTCWREWTNRH